MNYFSLNNRNYTVNFKEALFNGLAPDRGLYFPQEIKSLKKSFISNLDHYDKIEISMELWVKNLLIEKNFPMEKD